MLIATLFGLVGTQGALPLDLPKGFDGAAYVHNRTQLKFIENRGQWNTKAKFLAHGHGVDTWVTDTGFAYQWQVTTPMPELPLIGGDNVVHQRAVFVDFVGRNPNAKTEGIHALRGVNEYIGPKRTVVARGFSSTLTRDLYPGIDLVNYVEPESGEPRYDLIVRPGADPNQIRMAYRGAKDMRIDKDGQLNYAAGDVVKVVEQQKVAFQHADEGADYRFVPQQVIEKDGTVGFDVRGYKKDRTLVIDPLTYSTYIGGSSSGDTVTSIARDISNDTLIGGQTFSSDFPLGADSQGFPQGFVVKFSSTGITRTLATTFAGTTDVESVGLDNAGNIFFCGLTQAAFTSDNGVTNTNGHSTGLFVSTDSLGSNVHIDVFSSADAAFNNNAILSVNPSTGLATVVVNSGGGAVVWQVDRSNVIAGPMFTGAIASITTNGIATDASGNVYIAVSSNSHTIPFVGKVTTGPNARIDQVFRPSAILMKGTMASGISQATYLGGVGYQTVTGLAVDSSGNPVVFGNVLAASQTLTIRGVPVTPSFPTTAGAYDNGAVSGQDVGFICKVNPDLTASSAPLVTAATLFRSSGKVSIANGMLDNADNPVFCGTVSGALPLTWDYYSGHATPAFFARLGADLSTYQYGTYFGTANTTLAAVAKDSSGNYYPVGSDSSLAFPTTNDAMIWTSPSSGKSGIYSVVSPVVGQGLVSIHSDRGDTPAIAGGSGKTLNVSVNLIEPTGTPVILTADQTGLVTINGTADTGTVSTSGFNHVVTFPVQANDVAADTVVTLQVSISGGTLAIPVTIHPFLKQVILRAAAVPSGTTTTAYVTPWEAPATDQTVTLSSSPSSAFSSTSLTVTAGLSGASSKVLTVGTVATDTSVSVTASHGVSSVASSFTIQGIHVLSMACSPASVVGGSSSNLTVTLKVLYPTDVVCLMTSSNPAVAPSVVVTIPAGHLSGSAVVATAPVVRTVSVRFTDAVHAPSSSALLTVTH